MTLIGRLVVFGSVLTVMGCGGAQNCSVSGKVTRKGTPLVCGVVNLYGAKDTFASGGIDADGNYTVMDAPVGVVKISVVSDKPLATKVGKVDPNNPNPPAGPDPSKWFAIDPKYASPDTSGKEMTLSGGKNTKDITLE